MKIAENFLKEFKKGKQKCLTKRKGLSIIAYVVEGRVRFLATAILRRSAAW